MIPRGTKNLFCASGSLLLFVGLHTTAATRLHAAEIDFVRDVQPVFAHHCYQCHGPEKQKGGLRLDRKADAMVGGDSGAAIIPGRAAESRLYRFISGQDPETLMPPKGKADPLSSAQVELVRQWIEAGANWPEAISSATPAASGNEAARDHWAFRPVKRPPVPAVKNQRWVRNPIDSFVLSRLERASVKPSPEADRRTLIRRLSFDLTGLPPTLEAIEAFVDDRRPDAYEKLVDQLLNSPHYGEHWGRHWLDLARYADSDGYEKDGIRPYAYVYRDWVIQALNRDLPFDQFSIEQLAGDLLPNPTLEQKVATGFHRNTLRNFEGGVDQEEFRCKAVVDRVSTTGTVWLGLTVGCAECHTHKYDPITQREFYQLFAFFNNASDHDLPIIPPPEQEKFEREKKVWDEKMALLQAEIESYTKGQLPGNQAQWEAKPSGEIPANIRAILEKSPTARGSKETEELQQFFREKVDAGYRELSAKLKSLSKEQPKPGGYQAQTLVENSTPRKTFIHVRGDFLRKGDEVSPATLSILHPLEPRRPNAADRLDLAQWLFALENPLTARVTVNRVWGHLFGRALVPTINDFGTRGETPTHPELLDWLASEFPRLGWSQKALIKLIVTSAAYRQSSQYRPELEHRDPSNLLLARQNRFRVQAENVRDTFLAASGLLNRTIGGPGVRPPLPADIAALGYANSVKWKESDGGDRFRRGLYIFFQRTVPYPMLVTFDAPDSNVSCTRRERSNTPLQALTLLNDPVFFECAQAFGARVAASNDCLEEKAKLQRAFTLALGRPPTRPELHRLEQLYDRQFRLLKKHPENAAKIAGRSDLTSERLIEMAAHVTIARTLLNLDEFVTRE